MKHPSTDELSHFCLVAWFFSPSRGWKLLPGGLFWSVSLDGRNSEEVSERLFSSAAAAAAAPPPLRKRCLLFLLRGFAERHHPSTSTLQSPLVFSAPPAPPRAPLVRFRAGSKVKPALLSRQNRMPPFLFPLSPFGRRTQCRPSSTTTSTILSILFCFYSNCNSQLCLTGSQPVEGA